MWWAVAPAGWGCGVGGRSPPLSSVDRVGRGIAQELILKQEEWAKVNGATKIRLYVMGDKAKTIEFYNNRGYKQTEFLKNDIKKSDGVYLDVVVMEKSLTLKLI